MRIATNLILALGLTLTVVSSVLGITLVVMGAANAGSDEYAPLPWTCIGTATAGESPVEFESPVGASVDSTCSPNW